MDDYVDDNSTDSGVEIVDCTAVTTQLKLTELCLKSLNTKAIESIKSNEDEVLLEDGVDLLVGVITLPKQA